MPLSAQEHRPIWQADLAAGQSLKEASYHYLVTDHLGSPVLALNKAGETTWKARYEAFGKARIDNASTAQINLRLPGQYFDAETGLHQNWNRDYAPGIGRYVQADPIGLAGGINYYLYVDNNPMLFIDDSGLLKINLLEPDSKEYKQFERTKDIPDKIIIAAHGNYKGDIIDINKNIISVQMLVEIIQEHAKDWPANITGIDIRACGAGYGDESIAKRLSTQPVFVDFIVRGPEATITPDGTTWYEIAHFVLYPRGEKYMRSFRNGKKI